MRQQGPGQLAGIKVGDKLTAVNDQPVQTAADFERQIYRKGVYTDTKYALQRGGVPLDVQVILVPADNSLNLGLRLIALIYLGIGLFVFIRRWTAPKSTHFYIFCLVSFVFYAFKYTGKFNAFDWTIYWSNVTAWLLQPALFLHFALTFPDKRGVMLRHRWVAPLIYLPGALLLALHVTALNTLAPTELLRFRLDQLHYSYLTIYFVMAAGVLWDSYRHADTPILRQQMKWITRGTILAIAPFTIIYVIPTVWGVLPTAGMKDVSTVADIPAADLRIGHHPLPPDGRRPHLQARRRLLAGHRRPGRPLLRRHRRRSGNTSTPHPPLGRLGTLAGIMVTGLVFDPLKRTIQAARRPHLRPEKLRLPRDPDRLRPRPQLADRPPGPARLPRRPLAQTLLVTRVAVFLASTPTLPDRTSNSHGATASATSPSNARSFDLRFLNFDARKPSPIFLENPQQVLRLPEPQQRSAARLDLNYYLPCRVRQEHAPLP